MAEESAPKEFKALLQPKLQEDAKSSQVIWAKVKGYPWWPAQILSDAAASKKLGKVTHRSKAQEPVIFFGTLEIAWVGSPDFIDGFREGVQNGYLTKSKQPKFIKALVQVTEFLALDKKRKAPQGWWCRAPGVSDNAVDAESESEDDGEQLAEQKAAADDVQESSKEETPSSSSSSDDEPPAKGKGRSDESSKGEVAALGKGVARKGVPPTGKAKALKQTAAERKAAANKSSSKVSGSATSSHNDAPVPSNGMDADAAPSAAAGAKPLLVTTTASGSNNQQPTTTSNSNKRTHSADGQPPAATTKDADSLADTAAIQSLPLKKKLRTALGSTAPLVHVRSVVGTQDRDTAAGTATMAPLQQAVTTQPAAADASGEAMDTGNGMAATAAATDLKAEEGAAEDAITAADGARPSASVAPAASSTLADLPVGAPSAIMMMLPDDDVFKLPAEIRRLAGIKLVKKQQHSDQVGTMGRPKPLAVPSELTGESPRGDDKLQSSTSKGVFDAWADGMTVIGRRETRSGTTPRGGPSKVVVTPGAAAGALSAAPTPASTDTAKISITPATTPIPAAAVVVASASTSMPAPAPKPTSPAPAHAKKATAKATGGTDQSEVEKARRAERELQLQRKRERERERRQQLKLQKLQGAAAAAAGSEDESEDEVPAMAGAQQGDVDMPTVEAGVDVKTIPRELKRLQSGPVDDSDSAPAGSRSARERRDASPDRAAAALADIAAAAAAVAAGLGAAGKPPRHGSNGLANGRSASRDLKAPVKSAIAPRTSKERNGSGNLKGLPESSSSAAELSPNGKSSRVPVVSVSVGSDRKSVIPPVLAAQAPTPVAPVVVQPQPAKRSTLLTKRSSESLNTGSDNNNNNATPAATASGDMAGAGGEVAAVSTGAAPLSAMVGPSEEDLQDAEAAEALQFMQSMSLAPVEPALAPIMPALPPPVIVQLEAVLGAAMSAHGLASGAPLPQPAVYKVPRKRREDVMGFKWPTQAPVLPLAHENFYLPRDWLMARAPKYEPLKRNVWVSCQRPKRVRKEEVHVCQCKPPPNTGEAPSALCCGDNCLNRSSMLHCDPKYCPCGDLCTNKPFHLLKPPRVEAFLTENRGYGVRAVQKVKPGSFLVEYVGEVIDEKELSKRMEAARATAQHSYYIMELASGGQHLYIDARTKGGLARLINSSCNPNCETQKWHDASTGEPRVGIFSKREIEPGEELTYDYFFEQYSRNGVFNSAFFKCMCGAPNCRGMMDSSLLMNRRNKDYGKRIDVYWDADALFYRGTVIGYHNHSKCHVILYDDGDQEKINLDEVAHRWVDDPAPAPVLAPTNILPPGWHNTPPPAQQPLARTPATAEGTELMPARWGSAPSKQNGWGEDVEEGMGEEIVPLKSRRSSQDQAGERERGGGSRSIMGGHYSSVGVAAPPKKRAKAGQAGGASLLPPLRTALDNSYNSTSTTFSALPHASSAPAAFAPVRSSSYNGGDFGNGGGFGRDMECLLQAVEVELGDREAAAAGNSGNLHHGSQQQHVETHAESWPTSPRHGHATVHGNGPMDMDVDHGVGYGQQHHHHHQPSQHLAVATHGPSYRANGVSSVRSPRSTQHHHHHAVPAVRSPHRRMPTQQQSAWVTPQQSQQQAPVQHAAPGVTAYAAAQQEQSGWSWGGAHHAGTVQQPQHAPGTQPSTWQRPGPSHMHQQQPHHHHAQAAAAMDYTSASDHPHALQQLAHVSASASGSDQAGGVHGEQPPKLAVIEEVLGIRISTFDVPLFQSANGVAIQHRQLALTTQLSHGAPKNSMHPTPMLPSVINGLSTSMPTDIPPHMQRMPITTQAPGLGPSPTASSSAPSATAQASQLTPSPSGVLAIAPNNDPGAPSRPGPLAAHVEGAVNGKVPNALSLLISSPILTNLSSLHGPDLLAQHLDLFKRSSDAAHAATANGCTTLRHSVVSTVQQQPVLLRTG